MMGSGGGPGVSGVGQDSHPGEDDRGEELTLWKFAQRSCSLVEHVCSPNSHVFLEHPSCSGHCALGHGLASNVGKPNTEKVGIADVPYVGTGTTLKVPKDALRQGFCQVAGILLVTVCEFSSCHRPGFMLVGLALPSPPSLTGVICFVLFVCLHRALGLGNTVYGRVMWSH